MGLAPLVVHQRTHTGEKPGLAPASYTDKTGLAPDPYTDDWSEETQINTGINKTIKKYSTHNNIMVYKCWFRNYIIGFWECVIYKQMFGRSMNDILLGFLWFFWFISFLL